uniref:Uncharacterized protein n=1 Tax=Acrobeloides nanus TaxID=290746 RepID=A0A914C7F3_9BILA
MEDISDKPFFEKAKIKLIDLAESTIETIADTGESIKELGSTVKQSVFDDESKHAADRGMDVMEQLAERGRQHAAEAMVYGQAHGNTTGERLDEARKVLHSDY